MAEDRLRSKGQMAYGLSSGNVTDDVTWPQRCCEAVRSAILATAWLPVLNADVRDASMVRFAFSICSEDSKCVSIQPLFTMSMQRHEPWQQNIAVTLLLITAGISVTDWLYVDKLILMGHC